MMNRCWMQGSDEIFLDTKCCAMAFRLLRLNGYQVSSGSFLHFCQHFTRKQNLFYPGFFSTWAYILIAEVLADYDTKGYLLNSWSEYNNNTKSALELYKASQTAIFQNEPVLDRIEEWTATYLRQELSTGSIQEWSLRTEVKIKFLFQNPS